MAYYMSSGFSRTRLNEAKMGAYYTDLAHCRDIRKMLHFPEGEEVCCLEPSIGDGSAVITATGAAENTNIKIFGVELNDRVARETKANPLITECICADFTDGVTIRNNVFSFCFGNPPYMTERTDSGESRVRLERVFLDKVTNYLKMGGVLVWVIPRASFSELGYLRAWLRDFDTEAVYKFRQSEYEKYHQIVVIGRKRQKKVVTPQILEEYICHWNLSDPPELPTEPVVTIKVNPSEEKSIDIFTTKSFDEDHAYEFLAQGLGEEFEVVFDRQVSQKPYDGGTLSRPPIPLKKDSKYLLATSGFTDGIVGTEEEGNIHMMRGVPNVVDHIRYNSGEEDDYGEDSSSSTATVTTSTEVEIRTLENDGTITLIQ